MSTDLTTTKEFFASTSNSLYSKTRVQFAPKESEYNVYGANFLYVNEGGTLEIMVLWRAIGLIAKECHPVLESHLNSCSMKPTDEGNFDHPKMLVTMYYTTVGMMVTTHENHTVINMHKDIVFRILRSNDSLVTDLLLDRVHFLQKELSYLQALLTSNNNKLNKSPSLWALLKQLFIYCIDNPCEMDQLPEFFFIRTVITAAELHFSNYYAWNFMKFLFNVSRLAGNCDTYRVILEEVKKFAYSNHNDSAAWSCLADCSSWSASSLEMTAFEYNQHSVKTKLKIRPVNILIAGPSDKDQLLTFSAWLWKIKVTSEVPYQAFKKLIVHNIKIWKELDLIRELMGQVKIHCSLFEELKLKPNGISIGDSKGFLNANININEDYEFGQLLQNYFNWKCLLSWFEEFIKDKYVPISNAGVD